MRNGANPNPGPLRFESAGTSFALSGAAEPLRGTGKARIESPRTLRWGQHGLAQVPVQPGAVAFDHVGVPIVAQVQANQLFLAGESFVDCLDVLRAG